MLADYSTLGVSKIYFIRSGESGPIKIGRTNRDIVLRLKMLQVGSPEELHLIAEMPGHVGDECVLHAKFAHLRIRGEWFKPDPELLEFIPKYIIESKTKPPAEGLPIRAVRIKHIRCAYFRRIEGIPLKLLTRRYRVSERTINKWTKIALSYPDPEADGLRRMIEAKDVEKHGLVDLE